MFTYVKVKDIRYNPPLDYGWMIKVGAEEDVWLLETLSQSSKINTAFVDYLRSKEKNKHFTNRLTGVADAISQIRGISFVSALGSIVSEVLKSKIKLVNEYGCIYINYAGGFFPKGKTHIEYETYTSSVPSDRILQLNKYEPRYLQWENGQHWYVKVGDVDVRVDGQMKWDTYQEAKEAYEKYVSSI